MSRNAVQLAGRLHALETAVPAAIAAGVVQAALLVRASVATASGQYASSPLAATSATPIPSGDVPAMLVQMTNKKAVLLDRNTKAHPILPGADTGHRGRKQALLTPAGPRGHASSRGTVGKKMWERGVAAAIPQVPDVIYGNFGTTLVGIFR